MRDALRFIACGCEGGGKSTLTARLLDGAGQTSGNYRGKPGPQEDGLPPGFGQGMDAPYRFFATARRNFFAADTSERGMAAAACTAGLVVLVVDAAKGLEPRARTQLRIASMFGVRHAVLAINKMDAAGWDKEIFNSVVADFRALVVDFGFVSAEAVPLCALSGDNVSFRSARSAWYGGPALLEYLETAGDPGAASLRPFRMAVREIGLENGGFSGRVVSGSVAIGASVLVRPGGGQARVKSITGQSGARDAAFNGDAVTITLDRDLDIVCGQVLSSIDDPIHASDQFEASLLCMPGHHLMPGRPYVMRVHAARTEATITGVKYKLDVGGGSHLAAKVLGPDEIGEVTLYTCQPVAFEPYGQSRALGAFTLVDGLTNEIAGLGVVNFALRRASNIRWQALDVDKAARAKLKSQQPSCIWFTGLSGSGKSTIANLLEKRLSGEGRHTYLLDGDNVRHGLNRDLGFSEADRVENIRRVAEVAKLMVDAGLIVIVSFISPFSSEREFARSLFEPGEFREVFVDAPLDVCEKRDAKGLYAKARRGELANFTGIDSAYEIPAAPDVRLDTRAHLPEECVAQLLKVLKMTR